MTPDSSAPCGARPPRQPREAFRVVFVIAGLLILPAWLALRTVRHPGTLQLDSANPTPYGYTWSLLLFIIPLAALCGWFARRSDLELARKAFWRTIAVLAPAGFVLDLLFGNAFFTFPNRSATLGVGVPGVGGPIPIEEFVFYLTGFMLVLMSYLWADEYWLRAYNIPDYHSRAKDLRRIAEFHPQSVILGAVLLAGAAIYKKALSPTPEGFPWYFTYLTAAAIIPAAGFFRTAQSFINWRAFGFTFFLILLISLLWEATLAVPYGWWGYRPAAMMGIAIGAWHGLPLEAVCLWLAVSFTTVITYEVIKIWQALGRRAREAFFGAQPGA
ncbi:MAG TPA: lycopene cyclase domain-containing protein [Candidatus Acidoferrum sp.]|nr:lycopene cyclase domain-containing protein [Candidatus Acidoferrum sp.]